MVWCKQITNSQQFAQTLAPVERAWAVTNNFESIILISDWFFFFILENFWAVSSVMSDINFRKISSDFHFQIIIFPEEFRFDDNSVTKVVRHFDRVKKTLEKSQNKDRTCFYCCNNNYPHTLSEICFLLHMVS